MMLLVLLNRLLPYFLFTLINILHHSSMASLHIVTRSAQLRMKVSRSLWPPSIEGYLTRAHDQTPQTRTRGQLNQWKMADTEKRQYAELEDEFTVSELLNSAKSVAMSIPKCPYNSAARASHHFGTVSRHLHLLLVYCGFRAKKLWRRQRAEILSRRGPSFSLQAAPSTKALSV